MGKITHFISELSIFFKEKTENSAISSILAVQKCINVSDKVIGLSKKDNCKMTSFQVLTLLLLFPLFGIAGASHFKDSTLGRLFSCKKDMFYSFLSDERIRWRNLLTCISRQLVRKKDSAVSGKKGETTKCLVVDDTDFPKTGWKMELIGKVWSHVENKRKLGFKCLTLLLTDGKTQTFLDFSLHGEKGKDDSKRQGLTAKQRAARHSVEHTTKCSKERVEDYWKKKTDKLHEMVRKAVKDGFRFDYLLVDSWFTNTSLVKFVLSFRKNRFHLLGMMKMAGTYFHTRFGDITPRSIVAKLKEEQRKQKVKHIKTNKTLHCQWCMIDATLGGRPVRLFFCKRGRKGEWNCLLTMDMGMDFLKAYRTYQMRWTTEVAYHDCKQLLGLGKCQSVSFNAQIAATTITFMQYNILSLVKRFHSYETIGELFEQALSGTVEFSIADKIWQILLSVLFAIADKFSIYCPDLLTAIINEDDDIQALLNLNVKLRATG